MFRPIDNPPDARVFLEGRWDGKVCAECSQARRASALAPLRLVYLDSEVERSRLYRLSFFPLCLSLNRG